MTIPIGSLGASRTDARWARRPILGWTVRIGSIAGPLVASVLVAWFLTSITPTPVSFVPALIRWTVIATLSSLVLVTLERVTRRLLPIATLLELTLTFPDQAPSRFRVALRTGTTQQLERRIAEARAGTPADPDVSAGQRVIELVAALSVHDRITRGHSERVRAYTQMIAEEMGLSEQERDRLRWAGLLHDVGKLFVPPSILNKNERLTAEEYAIVMTHPEHGRRIVEELVPWLGDAARAVWEHHEKWDGSGYPYGLSGEQISLAARIVAVADVYDVMTSARSYKEPITPKEARRELARCAGTHFDPAVVRAFLNVSLGQVRRTAGPLSWAAQLTLFPSTVLGSTHAAGSAVVLTGAISASSFGAGTDFASAGVSALDPHELAVRVVSEPEVWVNEAERVPNVTGSGGSESIVVTTTPPRSVLAPTVVGTDGDATATVVITRTPTAMMTGPPPAAGVPPATVPTDGNADKGNADQGNADQGNADQGNADQGNADKGNADKGNADRGNADQGNADRGNADQGNADQGNADRGNADQGNADRGNADQGNADRGNADRGNADRGNADRGNADRGNADQADKGQGGDDAST